MSASKDIFVQGETATFTVADDSFSTVRLAYGSISVSMDLDQTSGEWTASVSTSALSGAYNWAIFADGSVVESGRFVVRVLASANRAVVQAIDAAMAKNAANGKYSVTVGEISLQDKTFEEMMKWRGYFASLADADESGASSAYGPYRTEVALL